jgi:hypothetical protein
MNIRYHTHFMKLALIGALFIVITASTCWSTKKGVNLDTLTKIAEMEKGPCFGRCPVFTLTIYDNGIASYEGERFTDRLGVYVKTISPTQLKELKDAFVKANVWRFKDVYRGQIPDLQTVTITYYEGDESKSVMGKDGRPDEIMELEEMLDEIVNEEGWELKEKPESDLPDNVIPNELIVQINNNTDINAWARQYAKQNMRVIRPLSPNGFFWLVSFDDQMIPPKQMLEFVKNDPDVISAEFNKNLDER